MSKNQEYAAQYAEFAMEQMKRYGIPASVTLAQGILESSNGKSELSRLGNNHFGIKATSSWIKDGGEYLVYTDDRPDEKFCKYNSVGESYEHHSEFLKNNKRYEECFKLSPDNYKGWTEGIAKAGYASGAGYATNLQKIIEVNHLDKYDQQVMQEMKAQGKSFGIASNPLAEAEDKKEAKALYSFPLDRKEFLLVTLPFAMKTDKGVNNGLDLQSRNEEVHATESKGRVIAVGSSGPVGKSVTIEYERADGNKFQTTYSNLAKTDVKTGDTVSAGQTVGTSMDSLHFEVQTVAPDGTKRTIDPAAYLAEVAQKGNLSLQVMHNGTDLLSKYKSEAQIQPAIDTKMSSEDWMKKVLSSEDSGMGLGAHGDPIMDMAMALYSGLLVLATQIDQQTEEDKRQQVTDSVQKGSIDLTSLLPNFKKAELQMLGNHPVLHVESGGIKVHHQLTETELVKISQTLGNTSLGEDDKRVRVASIVNSIVLTQQMSQNYQQGLEAQQSQSETLQRK